MIMQIMKLLYHSVRSVWIPLPQKTYLNGHTMPTLELKDLSSPIYMLICSFNHEGSIKSRHWNQYCSRTIRTSQLAFSRRHKFTDSQKICLLWIEKIRNPWNTQYPSYTQNLLEWIFELLKEENRNKTLTIIQLFETALWKRIPFREKNTRKVYNRDSKNDQISPTLFLSSFLL